MLFVLKECWFVGNECVYMLYKVVLIFILILCFMFFVRCVNFSGIFFISKLKFFVIRIFLKIDKKFM